MRPYFKAEQRKKKRVEMRKPWEGEVQGRKSSLALNIVSGIITEQGKWGLEKIVTHTLEGI